MKTPKINNCGRILIFLIPTVFLAGILGVLMLKLAFKGDVRLKVEYDSKMQKPDLQISDTEKAIENAKYPPTTLNDKKKLSAEGSIDEDQKHIEIMKKEGFERILPKPRSIDEIIKEMQKEKKEPPMVRLTEKGLEKKIYPPGMKEKPIAVSPTKKPPDLKEEVSYRAPIGIAVKYKIFDTKRNYDAFTKTHYGDYPRADFDKEMVVILISEERYPSKVFEIIEAKTEKDKIVIEYRVNVFKMAEEDTRDYYPAVAIKKTSLPIELKEII